MQRVSSQQGSSERPDGFLTLYKNTIRPAGGGGGGGGPIVSVLLLQIRSKNRGAVFALCFCSEELNPGGACTRG